MTDVVYDPTTWRDPASEHEEQQLSPMLRQYYDLKRGSAGCLLLMRVGDFYEAYGEDAVSVARLLDIVLTKKDAGPVGKIPMAGVPFFAVDTYLRNLVSQGKRVAIGDQVEDPKQAKGVVKRAVTRIVTSGTVLDPQMLDERRNNFIMALVRGREGIGIAVADVTTGEFTCAEFDHESKAMDELQRWRPAELLIEGDLPSVRGIVEGEEIPHTAVEAPDEVSAERTLREYYGVQSLRGFGVMSMPMALRAAGALMAYVQDTQKTTSLALGHLRTYSVEDVMIIDQTTRRNLELVETLMGRERRGSLLWALDECVTSMGARLLRTWIERPLVSMERILERHDAVEELVAQLHLTDDLRSALSRVLDLPRLLSRAVYGTANGRDLLALTQSLQRLPELASHGAGLRSARIRALLDEIDFLPSLTERLESGISPECPAGVREGNLINPGYDAELDELREVRTSGRKRIQEMEEKLRERTGIKSLKIGFNNVFGYYIEVTKANLAHVPKDFVRKQTIANGERYVNDELKQYEEKILGADERIKNLEYSLFMEMVAAVAEHQDAIRRNAERLAELDVLTDLAYVAARNDYVRPKMALDNVMAVEAGRHPVVERTLKIPFVPNDVYVDGEGERLLIITGPNMAGKSTYLRQVALIAVMAQLGSFVPAKSAQVGIVDRVFTRVGASDDLHLGQSTFLMEMTETANIINNATARSLVVLDEIGRGTSTFDGLSIAWAVAEHLHNVLRAKTLFATHFHELTTLERKLAGARAYRVAVKENRDDVVFLHRILAGRSDRSYGIYVAKLAGIPAVVLDRAREVLADLEKERKPGRGRNNGDSQQLSLFDPPQPSVVAPGKWDGLLDEIRATKIMDLTPLSALNLIHEWQKRLHEEG
jgi:DNA mismatch repair protein MutS